MADTKTQVEPCKYFRLHTNTSVDPLEPIISRPVWGHVPPNNNWLDGYHYFGRIKEYTIDDKKIKIVVAPLVQGQWNGDRDLRFRPLRLFAHYEMVFEQCEMIGEKNKPRIRFRSKARGETELITISTDELDANTVEGLIREITEESA